MSASEVADNKKEPGNGKVDAAAQAKRTREHWSKIAAAVFIMGLVGGPIALDHYLIGLDIVFMLLVTVLTIWCLVEFYRMCEFRGTSPFRGFGVVCGGLFSVLNWIALPGTLEWFTEKLGLDAQMHTTLRLVFGSDLLIFGLACTVFGALWLQATKRDNDKTFESISTTLFGVLYVWFLGSFLIRIRHLGADGMLGGENWGHVGSGLLVSCIVVSKTADIGGYLFGRKYGKRRMIPRISPKKSWEGLLAGLIMSISGAFLLHHYGALPLKAHWEVVVFALLVGGMGVLGDLAESLLKRGSGRKDTADFIPGFGGVLDVVDSLLLSAPVAYFLSLLLLRSHG